MKKTRSRKSRDTVPLKVVGNKKEGGGVKKVANDRNWLQTAAIEVCLPYNFAVVFDFMYFHFRASKTK
jgi:hypothetical protein